MKTEVINEVLSIDYVLFAGIARGRAIAFQVGLPEFGKAYRTEHNGRVTVTDVTKAKAVMLDAAYRAECAERRASPMRIPLHSDSHALHRDKARVVFEHGILEGIHEAVGESVFRLAQRSNALHLHP